MKLLQGNLGLLDLLSCDHKLCDFERDTAETDDIIHLNLGTHPR